jgi:alpha-glucosidase
MHLPPYLRSIHHDGSARYVSNSYPRLGETVTLRLRTAPDAPIRQILLRTLPDGEQAFAALTPQPPDAAHRWWTVPLVVSMPTMAYRFVLLTDDGLWTYNGTGLHEYTPTDYHDFRLLADYDPPRWVERSVFYQIFPDRFADGDPANNVKTGEWVYRDCPVQARGWDEPPGQGNPSLEFYGGDLQGIGERLPYLEELGVNALYLNPIFTAPSVHRYDVSDYTTVDPHLGGNAALADLRRATRERDMRIMLDIVPNHCGVEHPWFQEAHANRESAWSDHFIFHEHPHDYASWLNVKTLPKLDYRSAALRDAMYAAPDSVFRHWLRPPYSIDGWRVDVANMLGQHGATQIGDEVARGIRSAVKAENPDAYLISENFFDATGQLQGDQYDGNMNYRGFTVPLWDWLNEQRQRHAAFGAETNLGVALSTGGMASAWAAFRAPVPWAIVRQQFTLIDSHDTARIRSLVGGNDALHRLAAVLQFTYPGVPCVYYGDEIGLEAAEANAARQTMPWDEARWDHDLRRFYQRLIALRRTSPALIDGGFHLLHTDGDTIAFMRDTDEQQIVVVGYRGSKTRSAQQLPAAHAALADGTLFRELFSGEQATVRDGALPLPPMEQGAAIWIAE